MEMNKEFINNELSKAQDLLHNKENTSARQIVEQLIKDLQLNKDN